MDRLDEPLQPSALPAQGRDAGWEHLTTCLDATCPAPMPLGAKLAVVRPRLSVRTYFRHETLREARFGMILATVPFPWPFAVFTVIIAGAAEMSGNMLADGSC